MGVTIGPGNTLIVSAPGPQGPAGAGGAGGVSDGDKGDITVTNSGTSWTIDANAISTAKIADDAVTFDKIANVTGPALVGRQAATSGSIEAIGLGTGLTIDGSKQLSISASYAQQSVTMTAGTGLTGGGDLSANRTFAVAYGTTSGTACQGNDSRLSDARTPTAHTHAWSDITSGVPATFTPAAHTHALADIQQGGATSGQVLEWSGTAWAPATLSGGGGGTVTSVTAGDGLLGGTITGSGTIDCNFGTAGNTVCEGNDSRLSDARTPTAHTHGITDSYVGEIAAAADQDYTIDLRVPVAREVTEFSIISASGTCTAALKKGSDTIVGSVSVSSTIATKTGGDLNATHKSLATNDKVVLTISSNASATRVQFVVKFTAATGAIS